MASSKQMASGTFRKKKTGNPMGAQTKWLTKIDTTKKNHSGIKAYFV
jgi:hypothetical protein